MTRPLVLPFSSLDRGQLRAAGGKGANLGELTRAGFPVPPGFCVTTAAYAEVAAAAALGSMLEEHARTPAVETERLAQLASRAREALEQAPIPEAIEIACREAYRALGLGEKGAVAVRSSATAEDLPDASFAGQQDTYLNVVGEDAVIAAVRRCWASLFTDRAVVYRARNGVDPRTVELAVVVQRLVPARVAGVLFTVDPVTGHRGHAVLDASPGLGEAVVSGAVNPDHFVADNKTGAILERLLGDKKIAIEPAPGGGTRRVDLEGGGEAQACLDADEVTRLVKLGARVEAHYGAPQDIEWALDADGTPWLLQARPITTLFPLPPLLPGRAEGLRVYFSINVAQGVLRPLTPMGISAFRLLSSGMSTILGAPPADPMQGVPSLSEAAGRLFFDITPLLQSDVGRRVVKFIFTRMEARSGAHVSALLADPRLPVTRTSRASLARRGLGVLRRTGIAPAMIRTLLSPDGARSRGEAAKRAALALGDVAEPAGLNEKLEAVERLFRHGIRTIFLGEIPLFAPGFLCLTLTRALLDGIATFEEVNVTLRALPENPTTEMDLALWHLATRIRHDAASVEALALQAPAELAQSYAARSLPPVLEAELGAFLERYGARGVAEIDVGVARWGEDATHILGSLANYLKLPVDGHAPDAIFKKGEDDAIAMVDELVRRARDRGALRGRLVELALDRVRKLGGLREMPKFHAVQVLARARALLLEDGGVLVRQGRLDAADDIFFLTFPELKRAPEELDTKALARERRAVYAREMGRRIVPRILLSDGTEPAAAPTGSDGHLTGTPASAGVVTGKARVVMDPVGARIEPGEILVAPSTDPGWTPLFLTAGGLVMEMGGSMSHGAVVAREYGIPAVVGVPHATARITTGQTITVDGAAGMVKL